jgi:hypothetical protein
MIDEALHAFARVLLRCCSPRRAYEILRRVGALLPPHADRDGVLRASALIRRRGTCLSRALAVAARAPAAELVIAVTPRPNDRLLAHAWLELAGEPVAPSEVAGSEIARLGNRRVAQSTTC